MNRPATKSEAHATWRGESLATIQKVRLELSALESAVRAGLIGPRLDGFVEAAWDAAGRLSGIRSGPVTSVEDLEREVAR